MLRKTGQLDLALAQALSLHQNYGQDITLAWVYYDLWKCALEKGDWHEIEEIRRKILALNISGDQLLKTQVCWLMVKTGYKAIKTGVPISFVQAQLQDLTSLQLNFEPQLTGALLQLAAKVRINWAGYLSFNKWAQIENINEPEMLERLIIPVAKTLLLMPVNSEPSSLYDHFFGWIKKASLAHSSLFYANYYYVKLLLRSQLTDEAKSVVLELIKVKPREFWVWQLLANCLSDDPSLRYSAYCKALACGGKAEMLIGLRQEFLEHLIALKKWNQAQYEMDIIRQVRTQNNWMIPESLYAFSTLPEIQEATAEQTAYSTDGMAIDHLLWDKAQTLTVVITEINAENQTAFYWTENQGGGKVNLKKIKASEIVLGATYEAMVKKHPQGYDQIFQLRPAAEVAKWCKYFEGAVQVLPAGIGFCGEIFVNKGHLEKSEIVNGDFVSGFACLAQDQKKQKMGWKAIKIKK